MTNSPSEDYIQSIMDTAYTKWQVFHAKGDARWGFGDFVENLNRLEAVAVTIGKLHQQVCNGGFTQWLDNGYSKKSAGDTLVAELGLLAQESKVAEQLLEWVKEAIRRYEEYEEDQNNYICGGDAWEFFYADVSRFDDQYYALVNEEAWFPEVEAYLRKLETNPDYRPIRPLGAGSDALKPKVKIVRGDNVFAIIAPVRRAIQRTFGRDAAEAYLQQATSSENYEAVIGLSKQHVRLLQVS